MKKKKNNKNKKNKNKKTNRPPRARTKLASTFLVWTHHTKFHRNISSSLYELRIVHCVPVIPWEPNPSRLCSSSCPWTPAHAINRSQWHSTTGRHKFQYRKMGSTKLWLSYTRIVTESETDASPLQSSVVHTRKPVSYLSVRQLGVHRLHLWFSFDSQNTQPLISEISLDRSLPRRCDFFY